MAAVVLVKPVAGVSGVRVQPEARTRSKPDLILERMTTLSPSSFCRQSSIKRRIGRCL